MPINKSEIPVDDEQDTSTTIDNRWETIRDDLNNLQDAANDFAVTLPIDDDEKQAISNLLKSLDSFRDACLAFGRDLS